MKTHFFNFGNDETYHYFQWLTESGSVNTAALIEQAFNSVEGDSWFEMGLDVSYVAKDKLAATLEELLSTLLLDIDVDLEEAEIGVVWRDDMNNLQNIRCLFLPIFSLAISRVCCSTVAHALLVKHGKWNPARS